MAGPLSVTSHPPAATAAMRPDHPADRRADRPANRARGALVVAILIAAQLPLLLKLFAALWQRPQYQFYPVMLIGAAYLAWERWREMPGRDAPRGRVDGRVDGGVDAEFAAGGSPGARRWGVTLLLAALSLATLLLGGIFWLRSLALVSTILMLAGVSCYGGAVVGGRGRLLRAMVPSLVLLAVIIPPPGHLDDLLTLRLQHLAVRGSSVMLDLLHVPHVESGTVLEIPGRRLLIEQACAGINSLMSILGFALLLGFYRRRSAVHILTLLPGAFFFVLMANLLRITGEAWLKVRWNIDVLEGSRHEMLGMLLFFVCAALVVSLDALVQLLLHTSRDAAGDPAAEKSARETSSHRQAAPARDAVVASPRRLAAMEWTVAVAFASAGLFVLLRTASAWPVPAIRDGAVFHLPQELAGWHQIDDKDGARIERPQTIAAKSSVWRYRRGNVIAGVAIDYPFVGFHDLSTCYTAAGWSVDQRADQTDSSAEAPGKFARLSMNKSAVMQGDLLFALFDESGAWIGPDLPMTLADFGALRTWLFFSRHDATSGPTYQVQTFVQTYVPLSPQQERDVEQLFQEAGASLAKQALAQMGARK